jgi:hypothetical protein
VLRKRRPGLTTPLAPDVAPQPASEYQAEVDAADQELVGLPVIPEDGEEEEVSWMKEWAAGDVANKEVELVEEERDEAEEQLEVCIQRQRALRDKMQLLQRQNKLLQATSQVMHIQDFVQRWNCMLFTAGLWAACFYYLDPEFGNSPFILLLVTQNHISTRPLTQPTRLLYYAHTHRPAAPLPRRRYVRQRRALLATPLSPPATRSPTPRPALTLGWGGVSQKVPWPMGVVFPK